MAFHVPQRGRRKATEGTKRILLRESTFRLWNKRKESLDIKGLSNSQFAEILLHQNIEELRARSSSFQESSAETSNDNEPISSRCELFQSTPSSKRARIEIDVSPVGPGRNEEDTNTLVDVTGESVWLEPEGDNSLAQEISVSAVSIVQSMANLNPAFGSLSGDPFVDDAMSSDPGSVDESTDGSLSDYESSDELSSEGEREEDDLYQPLSFGSHEHSVHVDDSATLTAIESCPCDEGEPVVQGPQEEPENSSTNVLPELGPVTFEEHKKMLQEMVQKDFMELLNGKSLSLKYQAMYEGAQVMVDVEKIVPLFEGPCGKKSCEEKKQSCGAKA